MNKQNDRVYLPKKSAENLHLRLTTRTQASPMVLFRAAVTVAPCSYSPIVVPNITGKMSWRQYEILGRQTFRQHSAPPHSACVKEEWLKKEVTRFIYTKKRPPKSPDLNPLDLCGILESNVFFSISRRRFAGYRPKNRRLTFVQPVIALSAV